MMLDQQVPLQSVCRTLFDYEITWFGEREFYDPDRARMAGLGGLKLLGLQQIPQALPRPYHYSVENAVISDRDILDPVRPNRVILEIYPDVTQMIEGRNWHFDPRERARKLNAVVFDKTGTLTRGEPNVTDVIPFAGQDEAEVLRLAAAVEVGSEHPLGEAIVRAAAHRPHERGVSIAAAFLHGRQLALLIQSQDESTPTQ